MKNEKYELVRNILGEDFISPEDVMHSCKEITYSNEQLAHFSKTVPTQEILQWCRDNNFILIAGPNRPISLIEVREINNKYFRRKEKAWYTNQKFSNEENVEPKWYMIRKYAAPYSTFKNWKEQELLISNDKFVPNAPEFVWAITIYRDLRGIYLFNEISIRTSSLDNDKDNVAIGLFNKEGLIVAGVRNYCRSKTLGIAIGKTV